MKKLLSLILAMMMFVLPCLAEGSLIGGADEATGVWLTEADWTATSIMEDAIAAGRRVTYVVTVPEISGVDTGDASVDTAIVDFVKALGLTVAAQGEEYDMAVALNQKDVLTLGWAVNGEDVYVKSNLIGGTIVLSEPEVEPIISRLLDMFVLMEAMTEDEAADAKAQLPTMIDYYKTLFEQSTGSTQMTLEDLMALDYSAFDPVVANVQNSVEELTEITVPRICDAADHGIRVTIDNEEFVGALIAFLQLFKDNPKLMEYAEAQGGYTTEEARSAEWEMNGELYKRFGLYEDEEAYKAAYPTFAEALDEAMADLVGEKALDGDFVTTIYFNENDEIVYLTSVLPMFTETESLVETTEAAEVTGTTEILNVVYTRQTVAEGVSHVCNVDVDGEGVTIDVLAKDNTWAIRLGDMTTQNTLLTANVKAEDNAVLGDFAIMNDEGYTSTEGSFSLSYVGDETKVDTDIAFELHATEEYLTNHPDEALKNLSFGYSYDLERNGVDYSGKEVIAVVVNEVKVLINVNVATSDPVDSIMSGNVVRPAELDDSAFANWFVTAYNTFSGWTGTAMMALPESVLMLLLSSMTY